MTFKPTSSRLIAAALVAFALALALLAWRVDSGADPVLGAAGATTVSSRPADGDLPAGGAATAPSPSTHQS